MDSPHPVPPSALSRRSLLQKAGLGLLGAAALEHAAPALFAAETKAAAAKKSPAAPAAPLVPLNRFPRMMQDYFGARIVAREAAAEALHAGLRTRREAETYIRETTAKVRRCFGPLPEKTPLNPRVTKRVDRDAYTIENVIFDSRPNFPVTGNLYLPKQRQGPTPAVVGVCGHSLNGKAGATYQSFAQGLARLGYIVLIIDPIGQGERFQVVDAALRPLQGGSVREHLYVGNAQFLVGEFFGTWQAWDGIRALDYLLTRPEVDGKRIMVTGNSGGGTITSWLCALEPRFIAAAPSCFINTFRRMFESEQPADTEQCPPHTLALGLDHADFLVPFIPRHLKLLGQEKDLFDARGLEQSHARLQRLYTLLGVKEREDLFIGPDAHGYFQKNREAMYGWFNQVTQVATTSVEPALTIEADEVLWCTPKGQVAPLQPNTVLSFTREASQRLRTTRPTLTGDALKRAVTAALHLPARAGVADYRILRDVPNRGYPKKYAGHYAVETEPGILATVYRLGDTPLRYRVQRGPKRAVLYVSHQSADLELRQEPLVREIIAADPEAAFYACDVRGIGESQPNTTGQGFLEPYGSDYFYAIYGIMFDQPYPGQRTFDLLRLIDWLQAHGHEEIHLVAKGWGTIPATFAALLAERGVTRVTLKHALSSYGAVAEAQDYNWPLSSFVPDALKTFDLPDCYSALAAKNLRIVDGVGATLPA
ncbi:alpha/beta hydrolase [Horticoccus sp. 23ND18S-11]|uniref:alpha/beta hydrolase n=1 Tax=Horticoccus sp. 23ND18S-11 TaxID=3391832 RepID=UPI0039C964C9